MTRRLVLTYLAMTFLILAVLAVPLGLFFADRERERLASELERDANVIATVYEDVLQQDQPLDPSPAGVYRTRTGARVVITDRQGISRVDTGGDTPRDLSTRPEIATALAGERASGTRSSTTLGTELFYVAVPVASGGVVHGSVRLTLETAQVQSRIVRFWTALVAVGAVLMVITALVGWVLARSVTRPVRRLQADARRFASGDLQVDPSTRAGGPPELRALDGAMRTMARRLEALLEEQRSFVADASHQLRTPLTALRLRLENLQSDPISPPPPAAHAALDAAIAETDRLSTLVNDLLQLARAEQARAVQVADLAGLARDRVDTWGAVAEAKGVGLRLHVGAAQPVGARGTSAGFMQGGTERDAGEAEVWALPAPIAARGLAAVAVWAVPGAIEQVLDNLLDNALEVSNSGDVITVRVVSTAPDGSAPRLEVVDGGPGLSDADKLRALRRFWRGGQRSEGSGLGLPVVAALVSASGGILDLLDAHPVNGPASVGLRVVVTFRPAGS
ncbi:MAG: histidine kinase dimerization/phospho-acceptor domain-containing protein [Acidimicrobiales bacterium]